MDGMKYFLWNLVIIFIGMMPVIAIIINKINLNGFMWLIMTEILIASFLLIYRIYGVFSINLVPFYGVFFMVYLALMTFKLGHRNFNKAMSITLLLSYVLTEYWEIPIFVSGYLGLFDKEYATWTNQAYLLIVFGLLIKNSGIKFNLTNLMYFLIPLCLSAIVFINFPSFNYAGSMWFLSRIICFVFLGTVFLMESHIEVKERVL